MRKDNIHLMNKEFAIYLQTFLFYIDFVDMESYFALTHWHGVLLCVDSLGMESHSMFSVYAEGDIIYVK
jgi:hypothetical protein